MNDIGCYPVSFAVLIARLFKDKNKDTSYKILNVQTKNNFRGTDDEGNLKINFTNLFDAELRISIKNTLNLPTIIYGTKGKIVISNPWLPNKNTSIQVINNENNFIKNIYSKYSVYANTIKTLSDHIQRGIVNCKSPNMTLEDSMITSKILSDWRKYLYKV